MIAPTLALLCLGVLLWIWGGFTRADGGLLATVALLWIVATAERRTWR